MENNATQTPSKSFIPFTKNIEHVIERMSITEKTLFWIFTIAFIISGLNLLWKANQSFLVEIPMDGGTVSEGVIGMPLHVNPLLESTDTDRDLTALIYSGLYRPSPGGTLVPDLAESCTPSGNGLEYTCIIKKDATFHDGEPVTADDIVFTVERAQDPIIKSVKRPNWEGVKVERINQSTVQFTLRQAYAPFMENLTMGILPMHLWKDAASEQFTLSQFNVEPIGSGPFRVNTIKRNKSGLPVYYSLTPFRQYVLGKPHIDEFKMYFYANTADLIKAFNSGEIESMSAISAEQAESLKKNGYNVLNASLPRVFGLFFNQNQATIFTNPEVKQAIEQAIDKQSIIDKILFGFGAPANSPIPEILRTSVIGTTTPTAPIATSSASRIDLANKILDDAKWKISSTTDTREKKSKKETQTLSFSIATADSPELKGAAEIIKETLKQIHIDVKIEVFDPVSLNLNVIRPRKYDALLFGEVIGRDLDLFAFWHSSERNDPGYNIALYTNAKVDKYLTETRATSSVAIRTDRFRKIETEISNDRPAIFLYSPDFLYIVPNHVAGVSIGLVTTPAERFDTVYRWYSKTEKVWKFLVN